MPRSQTGVPGKPGRTRDQSADASPPPVQTPGTPAGSAMLSQRGLRRPEKPLRSSRPAQRYAATTSSRPERERVGAPLPGVLSRAGDVSVSGRREWSAITAAMVAVAAIVAGVGCQATTMSAPNARSPILIGPVACIGCAATPPPAAAAPLVDSSNFHYMASPYSWMYQRRQPALASKIRALVADPCSADVQVSRLQASARGVFAFLFAMTSVEVEVQAIPRLVPGGSCYGARPAAPVGDPDGSFAAPGTPPAPPSRPVAPQPGPEAPP